MSQHELIQKMQKAAKMAIDSRNTGQKMLDEIKSICEPKGLIVNDDTGEISINTKRENWQ